MSTYGDLKKAWARLRREYLDGKVLDAVVIPALPNHRWKAGLKPPVSSIALRM